MFGLRFHPRVSGSTKCFVLFVRGRGWSRAAVKIKDYLLLANAKTKIQIYLEIHFNGLHIQTKVDNDQPRSWLQPCRPARRPYTSLEPWLVHEEKLSYSESLRDPTGSAPGLLEKLEEEGSSTLQQSSTLFPASAWQSLRLPKPASGYRLPLQELLWFSLFRDSKEKSRDGGWFALTGVFSKGISFCREKKKEP